MAIITFASFKGKPYKFLVYLVDLGDILEYLGDDLVLDDFVLAFLQSAHVCNCCHDVPEYFLLLIVAQQVKEYLQEALL